MQSDNYNQKIKNKTINQNKIMLVLEKIRLNNLFKDMDIVEFRHGIIHVHSNILNDFSGRVATLMEYILDENDGYKAVFSAHMPGEGFNAIIKFEEIFPVI